jgi:hypothetical protein
VDFGVGSYCMNRCFFLLYSKDRCLKTRYFLWTFLVVTVYSRLYWRMREWCQVPHCSDVAVTPPWIPLTRYPLSLLPSFPLPSTPSYTTHSILIRTCYTPIQSITMDIDKPLDEVSLPLDHSVMFPSFPTPLKWRHVPSSAYICQPTI